MKKLLGLISLGLILIIPAQAVAEPIARSGWLATSEVWSGEVEITGDVTVPEGMKLTVMPGTRIRTRGSDDTKSGLFKDRPEITVYGQLDILGDKDNFVLLGEKEADQASCSLPLDSTETIVVQPYKIDTEPLREEFKQFRIQYVILWTILSFSIYYAIRNRN